MGFGPMTSSLPKRCATPAPSGRLLIKPTIRPSERVRWPSKLYIWWGEMVSNQRRRSPADLQSAPFDHSGISPQWSRRWDSNPQPEVYKTPALPIELRRRNNQSEQDYIESHRPDRYIILNNQLICQHLRMYNFRYSSDLAKRFVY